jgi:hypothetical protein
METAFLIRGICSKYFGRRCDGAVLRCCRRCDKKDAFFFLPLPFGVRCQSISMTSSLMTPKEFHGVLRSVGPSPIFSVLRIACLSPWGKGTFLFLYRPKPSFTQGLPKPEGCCVVRPMDPLHPPQVLNAPERALFPKEKLQSAEARDQSSAPYPVRRESIVELSCALSTVSRPRRRRHGLGMALRWLAITLGKNVGKEENSHVSELAVFAGVSLASLPAALQL